MRSVFRSCWRRTVAAWLLGAGLVSPAAAVVIPSGDDSINRVAPANDPGWNYVGVIGGGSGVYLGNRWVITAGHVGAAPMRMADGKLYAVSFQSEVQLTNPGDFAQIGLPDLRMFRLAADPGLPVLPIATSIAQVGAELTMIGAGKDRNPQLMGWQVAEPTWINVPLPAAQVLGYSLNINSTKRWGINRVATETVFRPDATAEFSTRFDQLGSPYEAQAAVGDSGGGAFHYTGDHWELAGIITSTNSFSGQPSSTAVFGNETFIADLGFYHDQIVELVSQGNSLWQNPANRFDVSNSSGISPRDFLLVVNELLATGSHELNGNPNQSDRFYDVTGDFAVTPQDALQIANYLLAREQGASAAPLARAAGVNVVPEPSGRALALVALVLAAVLRGWVRWRRVFPAAQK